MVSTLSTALRAWVSHRQGLDVVQPLTPADGLAATGWSRTIGGANPYVSAFARHGIGRAELDRAVAALEVHELPSARGCTYLLPEEDFAFGLRLAQPPARVPLRELAKLNVIEAEVRTIAEVVIGALESAGTPMVPAQIRERVAVPSLGEAGRRKGLSTPLPAALGLLQAEARIRRVPVDGRLDNQRYAYTLWADPPRPADIPETDARRMLADRYWRWTGVASLAHFRWFSALGVRDAKAAVADIGLVPLAETGAPWLRGDDDEPDGARDALADLLVHPALIEQLTRFEVPEDPEFRLVTWVDGVMLLRRDLSALLEERDRPAVAAIAGPGGLSDMPTQAIMDRGRIVGVWEYDADDGRVVAASFDRVERQASSAPAKALAAQIQRMEAFIERDLGDMTGSSLDTMKTRRPRVEAIAALRDS